MKIAMVVKLSEKCDVFSCPVTTVINSDDDYEKTYQDTAICSMIKCILAHGEEKNFSIDTFVNFRYSMDFL